MVYSRRPFFVSDLVLAQPMKSPMIVKKTAESGQVLGGSCSSSVVFVLLNS